MPGNKRTKESKPTNGSTDPEREDPFPYAVGWGKPPKATQFKAGQSGNPKGRPKKPKTMQGLIDQLLEKKILAKVDGKSQRMASSEAFIIAAFNQAMRGDIKDKMAFMAFMEKVGVKFHTEKDGVLTSRDLDKAKEAVLREVRRLKGSKDEGEELEKTVRVAENKIIAACPVCKPQIQAIRRGEVAIPDDQNDIEEMKVVWYQVKEDKKT